VYIVICQKNLCIENIHNTAKGTLGLNTYDNLELISVHIPKCGGTTFSDILRRIYGDKYSHVTDISQLNDIDKNMQCIHGHYYFNPEWLKIYPNAKICTWIRNPVDRLISYYYYWGNYRFGPGVSPNHNHLMMRVRKYSIFEFAKQEYMQNRMFDFIEKISLDEIAFIGEVENYNSDLKRLAKIMNWDHLLIQKYNVLNATNYNKKVFDKEIIITNKDRQELADILEKDMRRYEYIKQYKGSINNYWRYATCQEKRAWDKIVREKSYLPS